MPSVHSGSTKTTLNPQTWPEYDELGFDAVQSSFINFGQKVFSAWFPSGNGICVLTLCTDKTEQALRTLPDAPTKLQDVPFDLSSLPTLLALPDLPRTTTTTNTPHVDLDGDLALMLKAAPETPGTTTPHIDLDGDLALMLNEARETPDTTTTTPHVDLDGDLSSIFNFDTSQHSAIGYHASADDFFTTFNTLYPSQSLPPTWDVNR